MLGYTVNFRREHGPWRQTDIHPLTGELWLDSSMKCGTNYTIYMTSYNHVGPGHASSVLAAKTLGRVPDIPNPSDLMVVNKVLITYTAICLFLSRKLYNRLIYNKYTTGKIFFRRLLH